MFVKITCWMKSEVWREHNTWYVSSATLTGFNGYSLEVSLYFLFLICLEFLGAWKESFSPILSIISEVVFFFLGKFIFLLEDNRVSPNVLFCFVLGVSLSNGCFFKFSAVFDNGKVDFLPEFGWNCIKTCYSFPKYMISLLLSVISMNLKQVFFCWLSFERFPDFWILSISFGLLLNAENSIFQCDTS